MNMQKITYAVGGAMIVLLVAVPALLLYSGRGTGSTIKSALKNPQFAAKEKFSDLPAGSFGSLLASASPNSTALKAPAGMGGAETQPANRGIGGGGGDAKIGMPAFMDYRFEYKGEEFGAPEATMEVLKRIKDPAAGRELANTIKNTNMGLLDTSKLSQARLQSFSMAEDREYGLIMNVSLEEGSVNLYENYLKWRMSEEECQDQACFDRQRMKFSDMPSNDEVVQIAKKFAVDYSIDLSGYGEPRVDDMWRQDYERAENKKDYYLPEVVTVIFPYKVNESLAYDESGANYGLNVSVNVKKMRVSGMYNLLSRNYQRSAYDSEMDTKKIIAIAEKGGFRRFYSPAEDTKVPVVELGTPTIAYMLYYQYQDNQSSELLVPAYVFPVTKVPDGIYFWMKNVVVPIPAELLKETQADGGPMPLMKTEPAPADSAPAAEPAVKPDSAVDSIKR